MAVKLNSCVLLPAKFKCYLIFLQAITKIQPGLSDSAYMPNFSVSVESDSKNKTTIVWTKCFVQPAINKFPSKHPDLQLRELQRVYLKTVKQI